MGTQYAGADTFPADYTIPDDLDDDKAATFTVALEALGDRTTRLKNHSPRFASQIFTTPGAFTWTCPERVTTLHIRGVGGGGSGGVGGGGGYDAGGGTGGGGARQGVLSATVVPGVVYSGTIPAVAVGGAPGGVGGAAGVDGGDATITIGATTYTFYGAAGGTVAAPVAGAAYTAGSAPIRNGAAHPPQATLGEPPTEGVSGWGMTATFAPPSAVHRTGGHSAVGRGGSPGTDAGGAAPGRGWGGSGGGASGWAGAVAGNGGNAGVAGATGGAGGAGSFGAGGGGGGGSGGTGGNGGDGGGAAIALMWAAETP